MIASANKYEYSYVAMMVLGQITVPANLYDDYVLSYHFNRHFLSSQECDSTGFVLSKRPNNFVQSINKVCK